MKSGKRNPVLGVVALLLSVPFASAAGSPKLSGSIAGIVRDGGGVPQMGATVLLFNRYERIIQRALTNERGAFGFEFLQPDAYSVRVSLASFVPAMKHKIAVQPGMQSLLYINLASLLSSMELVYATPGQGALMSDDWKWTLKTSTATRPVLRFTPNIDREISISDPDQVQRIAGGIFSDTRGLLRVSGGDSGSMGDLMMQPDLGTAFALATSLFGSNKLQVSGNVGHTAGSAIPAASFRTSYSREGNGPEVAVTMRQVYLPRIGPGVGSQQDALPALRTMSLAMIDRLDITEDLRLEYGTSLDTVTFVDHLNYFSPFARLTYQGTLGTLKAGYSSGAPPAELFARSGEAEAALHQDLIALALMPRVSLKSGRAAVQRTQSFEVGYEKKVGGTTLNVSGFHETVWNGALTLAGGDSLFLSGDVLPDLSSTSATFNVGNYQRYGYSACVTHSFGDKLEVSGSSGRAGVFVGDPGTQLVSWADDVRSKIHTSQRYWAAVRATGTLPVAGTQISTSYEWMDYDAIMPTHLYLTQGASPDAGLNVHIRQPIRGIPGMSGRLEATADLRNLFAQGYLPLPGGNGQRMLLMQSPRALRGGLSFIF